MKLTIQVLIEQADGSKVVSEVMSLEREALSAETLGLTLAESKSLLTGVQEVLVAQQAASFSAVQAVCPGCGAARRRKGQHQMSVVALYWFSVTSDDAGINHGFTVRPAENSEPVFRH